MPYNEGATLDMINEPTPETIFVKDPGTVDTLGMYNSQMVNPISNDMNLTDDSNDFSLNDLKDKTNQYSKKIMDMFGINKGEEEPVKPIVQDKEESLEDQVKDSVPETKLENNLSNKTNTKAIQNYMAKPDDDLKSLIGDKKYNGPVDGMKNDELDSLLHYLEAGIAKTIGNKDVFGVIANTYVDDIKTAVKSVVSYKKYLMKVKVGNMNLDDRFVELAKFIK